MKKLALLLIIGLQAYTLFSQNLTRTLTTSDLLKIRSGLNNSLNVYNDTLNTDLRINPRYFSTTGFQLVDADDSEKNNFLVPAAILDTLVAFISGSTVPPLDSLGGNVTNGGFTIERSGNDPVTGNGIDEITRWNFTAPNQNIDSSSQVISALLTLIIEQKDAGAFNDFVQGDNCGCTPINVGFYPLNVIDTVQFEMLNLGYPSQLFIDHLMANGLPMFYQDDAIVSFAELRLIISEDLNIIDPKAGDQWIAGEQDTIRWEGGTAGQFIHVELSVDSGNSYSLISNSIPADSGYYIWNIPQQLLSTKVKVKISDLSDSTVVAISDTFKIKGYVLTRIDANGNYDRFRPEIHGWKYSNNRNNMWPFSWWSQFDYHGLDPLTNKPYLASWTEWPVNASFENFPDWPLYVRTFGIADCYLNVITPVYNPMAVMLWALRKGETWHGTCHGFAVSSLAAFEFPEDFRSYFNFPPFINLYNVELDILPRLVVNQCWTAQWGLAEYLAGFNRFQDPNTTLAEIKNMFLGDDPVKKVLEFSEDGVNNFGNGGFAVAGHSVVPYKVVRDEADSTREYVYIYDNNHPADTTRRITFLTSLNGWEYLEMGWDGDDNIYLSAPISSYLTVPNNSTASLTHPMSNKRTITDLFTIYNSSFTNISIHNSTNDSIGYRSNFLFNTFTNGYPMIPSTSISNHPIGYALPADNYTVRLDSSKQENTYVAFVTDSVFMMFGREDADSIETDKFNWENGLLYETNDPGEKSVNFRTILISPASQKVFDFLNCNISQNDSIHLSKLNRDDLQLKNFGNQKFYDLKLEFASTSENPIFFGSRINLPINSTHQICPDWNDLHTLNILQDIGNDGTIDDTLLLINEATIIEDEGSLSIPDEYQLAQNYPNPFNPVTQIRYQIPQTSLVTLTIFDILGREVATLVNEERPAGNYQVEFNAAGLSGGIYFYQIQAGSFVETRKMILLK